MRFRLRHFRRWYAESELQCLPAIAAFLRVLLAAPRLRQRIRGLVCPFFFGAFPQPQAFIEPRPAPTVRKVVLIQASLTLSGGGLGPPASPRGRVGAGASGPDQERGLRGRRDHFSPSPRSEAASGLV